jgi:hypothetical protein
MSSGRGEDGNTTHSADDHGCCGATRCKCRVPAREPSLLRDRASSTSDLRGHGVEHRFDTEIVRSMMRNKIPLHEFYSRRRLSPKCGERGGAAGNKGRAQPIILEVSEISAGCDGRSEKMEPEQDETRSEEDKVEGREGRSQSDACPEQRHLSTLEFVRDASTSSIQSLEFPELASGHRTPNNTEVTIPVVNLASFVASRTGSLSVPPIITSGTDMENEMVFSSNEEDQSVMELSETVPDVPTHIEVVDLNGPAESQGSEQTEEELAFDEAISRNVLERARREEAEPPDAGEQAGAIHSKTQPHASGDRGVLPLGALLQENIGKEESMLPEVLMELISGPEALARGSADAKKADRPTPSSMAEDGAMPPAALIEAIVGAEGRREVASQTFGEGADTERRKDRSCEDISTSNERCQSERGACTEADREYMEREFERAAYELGSENSLSLRREPCEEEARLNEIEDGLDCLAIKPKTPDMAMAGLEAGEATAQRLKTVVLGSEGGNATKSEQIPAEVAQNKESSTVDKAGSCEGECSTIIFIEPDSTGSLHASRRKRSSVGKLVDYFENLKKSKSDENRK